MIWKGKKRHKPSSYREIAAMPSDPSDWPPWPPAWPEIGQSVAAVINSGEWGKYHSDICGDLETRVSARFDVPACRLTCSGSAAIELALRAARVGPGDEVILAAYDYPGNFRSIEILGATPVLVDIAPGTPCIDSAQLENAASDQVVAVIASHLYGQTADVMSLRQLCDTHGWILIEDACQVPGMRIGGRPAGSFGDVATLSFGGSKPLTAGSGGAILVSNDRLNARLSAIIDRPSDTFPLSPLQAAVLPPQLERLDEMNAKRSETVRYLVDALPEFDWVYLDRDQVDSAFYKLAWKKTGSVGNISTTNDAAALPIGAGFRTSAGASDRRCRKPVPLDRSIELSETCCVLDHRALLVAPDRYDELAERLRTV
jgi:dTDP-4-amino-4,6-dideoxygalactose transaminase